MPQDASGRRLDHIILKLSLSEQQSGQQYSMISNYSIMLILINDHVDIVQ